MPLACNRLRMARAQGTRLCRVPERNRAHGKRIGRRSCGSRTRRRGSRKLPVARVCRSAVRRLSGTARAAALGITSRTVQRARIRWLFSESSRRSRPRRMLTTGSTRSSRRASSACRHRLPCPEASAGQPGSDEAGRDGRGPHGCGRIMHAAGIRPRHREPARKGSQGASCHLRV